METFQLKRPTGIYLIAVLFIGAPFGNLLINFFHLLPNINSVSFMVFLKSVSAIDWMVLALTFVSGVLLLRPHKTSWSLAIATLVIVLTMNIYRWNNREDLMQMQWSQQQLILSCLTTGVFLIFAFYFRFPYLDRRAQWFLPTARRHLVHMPAKLLVPEQIEGVVESLSVTGARFVLEKVGESLVHRKSIEIELSSLDGMKLTAQVVKQEGKMLRLKFHDLSAAERKTVSDWLRKELESK